MEAREITEALGGRWCGSYGHARCPTHDDHEPSLTLKDNPEGGLTVHCFAGCDWQDVKDALRRLGLLPRFDGKFESLSNFTSGHNPNSAQFSRQAEDDRKRTAWVKSIWDASETAQDSPVSNYLESRGIHLCPPTIRFYKALRHADTGLYFGAMVAAVTRWPSRDVVGIHRTFLQPLGRGKAQVSSPKKMGGLCGGGAVRLGPHSLQNRKDCVLGLAEGIETALSVQQATGISVWACLSTSGLRRVLVPNHVTEIRIFADHDPPGIDAANEAADRFIDLGKTARIAMPPAPGQDFNSLLMEPLENGR